MTDRKLPGGEWGLEHGPTIAPQQLFPFAIVVNGNVRTINALCWKHGEALARFTLALSRLAPQVGIKTCTLLVGRMDLTDLVAQPGRKCLYCPGGSRQTSRVYPPSFMPPVALSDCILQLRDGKA